MRRAEKAAAIKMKREELEALRRALANATKPNPATSVEAVAGERFGLTGGVGAQQMIDNGNTVSGSALSHSGEERRHQRGILGMNGELPHAHVGEANAGEETVKVFEQARIHATRSYAPEITRTVVESMLVGDRALDRRKTTTGDQPAPTNTGDSSCSRPILHPPLVGVSPPRSEQEGRKRWFEHGHESPEREKKSVPDMVTGTGTTRATNPVGGGDEGFLVVRGSEPGVPEDHRESSEGFRKNLPRLEEQRRAGRVGSGSTTDEVAESDNPLHR